MQLRDKFLLAFLAIVAAATIVMVTAHQQNSNVAKTLDHLDRSGVLLREVARLGNLVGSGFDPDSARLRRQIEVQAGVVYRALTDLQRHLGDDAIPVHGLAERFASLRPTLDRLLQISGADEAGNAKLLRTVLSGQLQVKIERLLDATNAVVQSGHQSIREAHAQRARTMMLAGIGFVAVMLGGFYGIGRSVLMPLEHLKLGAEALSHGQLQHRVTLPRSDEIGELGVAFNAMAERLEARGVELDAAKQRLRLLLDCAGEGIYGLDRDGTTTFVNPAAARMLGYTPEQLLGQQMHKLVHHSYPDGTPYPREQCHMYAAFTDGTVHRVDDEVLWRKDGSSFAVEYHSTPVVENGELVGAVVVFKDITERQRQLQRLAYNQRRLTQTNQDLEEFAYVVSHDLKAPLRGIRNLACWIAEDLGERLPAQVGDNIVRMNSRIDSMEALIADLLDYSRKSRERHGVESVSPRELVLAVADLVGATERFEVSVQDAVGDFDTVRTPLETVLRNLLSNAVKHHDRDHGSITIVIDHCDAPTDFQGPFVRFSIRDDGPGIPEQHHKRIFMLFQSLSRDGSGMGLAVVKKLVERYGGSVDVYANSDRRGSRFEFQWPLQLEQQCCDDEAVAVPDIASRRAVQ